MIHINRINLRGAPKRTATEFRNLSAQALAFGYWKIIATTERLFVRTIVSQSERFGATIIDHMIYDTVQSWSYSKFPLLVRPLAIDSIIQSCTVRVQANRTSYPGRPNLRHF